MLPPPPGQKPGIDLKAHVAAVELLLARRLPPGRQIGMTRQAQVAVGPPVAVVLERAPAGDDDVAVVVGDEDVVADAEAVASAKGGRVALQPLPAKTVLL